MTTPILGTRPDAPAPRVTTILAISGSPSPTSKTARVLRHVADSLPGLTTCDVRILKVRDLSPEVLLGADPNHPEILAVLEAIRAADGVIIATPVYKAAYSGVLKALLDLLPQFALEGKVVLPLATGGTIAHVLAIDYALRPVLNSMGATHVVPGFFILDKLITEHEDGIVIEEPAQTLLDGVVRAFVTALRT
ncbi:FMN reductase [Allocatelliglobosispora scoriae]|uniref:FMN reductase n=1 Tax=Allocatelliglobosispora scoriae TaxID=643052 RepID=A0A841C3Y5_9ACTN|nr:NADPH-dependent FMN reductase [Allocatelliglobosispora scoriae]MBB5873772.1 FMN reductase [Allocatelliglobosispora scoriae]